MNTVFEKVSLDEFYKEMQKMLKKMNAPEDIRNDFEAIESIYKKIKLPKRATKYSAGNDFFAPFDILLKPGKSFEFPTGIRVKLPSDKFLMCVPRSGLGFKYRLQLDNTCGIIDADYYYSDNEGHIRVKLTNDGREGKDILVPIGEAFMQGIILQYFTVDEDTVEKTRNGGLGSTDE